MCAIACALVVVLSVLAPAPAHAASPHTAFGSGSAACSSCHASHAATASRLFRAPDEVALCYTCHATAGPGTNAQASFALQSGHTIEKAASGGDLTNTCESCHNAHLDAAVHPGLPRQTVNATPVDGAGLSLCVACHNETFDWLGASKAGYEALLVQPSRDASGYPVAGTYAGPSVYAASAHARITAGPASGPSQGTGDCTWCHASHRGPNKYDGLIASFRPSGSTPEAYTDRQTGEYARVCVDCHDGTVAGAGNIKQYITAAKLNAGHVIQDTGGTLPMWSALPCYECHNPHGSKLGNTAMISDALGGNLNPYGDALQVRQFCFTCHSTYDTVKGWDSDLNDDGVHDDGGYVDVTGKTVVGFSRTVQMRLPGYYGVHSESSTQNCNTCHENVHLPRTIDESNYPDNCYKCHTGYRAMEHGSAAGSFLSRHVLGTNNPTTEYPAAGDSMFADVAGVYPAYPAATTDGEADTPVYCLSCHVGHDKFVSGTIDALTGGTLRSSGSGGPQTATMADFIPDTGGVCVGCHSIERVKDADHVDSGSRTAAVTKEAYAGSAHDYVVQGGILGNPQARLYVPRQGLQANCSKCHNDSQPREWQAEPGFALHLTPYARLLAALGRTGTAATTEEGSCYACHSVASDGLKSVADKDWYNSSATMSAASQAIYGQFQLPFTHDLGMSTGAHKPTAADEVSGNRLSTPKHIECTDCHNSHAAGDTAVSGTKRTSGINGNAIAGSSPLAGTWGVEPPATAAGAQPDPTGYTVVQSATKEYQICLKCHSNFNAGILNGTSSTWTGTETWTNQAAEFNPANAYYHPVMAPTKSGTMQAGLMGSQWKNVGQQTMYCSDCHKAQGAASAQGPHGSAARFLLRATPLSGDGVSGYIPQLVWELEFYTPDRLICNGCHDWRGVWPHRKADHAHLQCIECHNANPHSGTRRGLLRDDLSCSVNNGCHYWADYPDF